MTAPATREEWLEGRRIGLGGSEIGAVMGDEGTCARKLAYEKLGATPDYDDEPALFRLGRFLEAFAADEYVAKTGRALAVPPVNHFFFHPEVPIAFASPDRFITTEANGAAWAPRPVLEIKSHNHELFRMVQVTGATDANTRQLHWTMACTGAPFGAFAHLDRESGELLAYDVARHDGLVSDMLEAAQRWWRDHVEAESLPEALPSLEYCGDCRFRRTCKGVTSRALAPEKRKAAALERLDDPELEVAVSDYLIAGSERDAAEERRDDARRRMLDVLGDREGVQGFKVHARPQEAWRWDGKALDALPPVLRLERGTIEQAVAALEAAGLAAESVLLREQFRLKSTSRPVRVYTTNT